MSEINPDFYRDDQTMAQVKNIAAGIFARYGVDFASAKRAGGWSNATWLAGGLALRMAVKPGNQNIRREARLAALFPPEVGYPQVLETGVTEGYEWGLATELPGRNLGEVWPELSWDERSDALRQFWQKAQAVHTVDPASAAGLTRERPWFYPWNAEEARANADRMAQQGILTAQQVFVLGEVLDCFYRAYPTATCVLNHGDLTIENSLWHAGKVTALLDFEYAVVAPVELDLNELLKYAFGPPESPEPLSGYAAAGPDRLRQTAAELARLAIAHPGGKDLLLGYAVLLELWMLHDWLAHPEGEGPLEQWEPRRRLISLADGQAGYLAPIFS